MSDYKGFHYNGFTVLYKEIYPPIWEEMPSPPEGIYIIGKSKLGCVIDVHADDLEDHDKAVESRDPDTYIYPLYGYFKRGVRLAMESFGCQFDSGRCGTIIVKFDEPTGVSDYKLERIKEYLSDYNSYYNGETDGLVIEYSFYWHGTLHEETANSTEEIQERIDRLIERDRQDG